MSETQAKVAWSSDGSTVSFVRDSGASYHIDWEVMSIPREGGTPKSTGLNIRTFRRTPSEPATHERFERLSGMLDSLDLHPDGASLLVSSAVNPKMEVWVLEGVSAAPRQR